MSKTDTPTLDALVVRRTYKASRERVFDALTKPDVIRRWMGPPEVEVRDVQFEAREGAKYRIEMSNADGERYVVGGMIRELRAPERVSYTWQWEDDDGRPEGDQTLVTVDLCERGVDTELVLTHERFTDPESRARHNSGWSGSLDKLGEALQNTARSGAVKITGIDLSGFMVKDAARAIAFYRDVLGLEPVKLYPDDRGAEYELADGTAFGLWGGGGNVMPFQPSNGILFAVDDLEATVATLRARGIAILSHNEMPGCFMAAIADTEGNTIFLHERKPD
jgi:uncharacterized protein YndB with AHSA1/START domain/predicted enzyme related to lactoylglutathione lyase